jgi:hypothetical protein
LFEKGREEEKKRTLSLSTTTRIEGSLVTPSLCWPFSLVSQCTYTHDNTNIDRFSTAVDRSCHPAPPIARTFFSFLSLVYNTRLLFYQRPIRSTVWLFQKIKRILVFFFFSKEINCYYYFIHCGGNLICRDFKYPISTCSYLISTRVDRYKKKKKNESKMK